MERIGRKIRLKKFNFSLIKCLIFATLTTLITSYFFSIIWVLFSQESKITNYINLLPLSLRGEKAGFLSRENFVIFCLLSAFLYSLFSYSCESQAENLIIQINSYLKNHLLRKFRSLKFEEKSKKKEEINSLVEIESNLVAKHWVNLWKEMYKGILSIAIMLYTFFQNRNTRGEIGEEAIFFTVFWLIFNNVYIYFFNKNNFGYGKLSKEKTTTEYGLINKEINNSILIDGTGANFRYENLQQNLTRKAAEKESFYRSRVWLGKIIPWNFLVNFFPFLLLIFDKKFIGINLAIIWNALNDCVWAFGYLWNYPDYSSSFSRIKSFLSLPEKNDNLAGVKWRKNWKIKLIVFENVSFRYNGKLKWVLKKYNRNFVMGKINHLLGKNGAGKSTILYLLLGIIKPLEGKIIIETTSGLIYNLHKEINFQSWRKNNVVYLSHENLIKVGSTGQNQWININETLQTKKEVCIFLFDEAENVLDKEKQQLLQEKVKRLIKQKKVVINAKCWEN